MINLNKLHIKLTVYSVILMNKNADLSYGENAPLLLPPLQIHEIRIRIVD